MATKESNITYISLFSSAGVGCFGFKMAGYDCIATNEIIPRRLEVQKFNKKCKYDSGYICGDIANQETKDALFSQIDLWKKKGNVKRVDVLIATPPCQGMSVANHKKSENEIVRNSLVIESIKIIKELNPKFFIFENVPAFMKTTCTDIDGNEKPICEAIENNLGEKYSYISRVINFKNYGACSSRQRTLVIGVARELADEISPLELYPEIEAEKTRRQVIGDLKPLDFGEIDANDFYHAFRTYPEHMRAWIHDLSEGQSAFDNKDIEKRPHQIINGKIVANTRKNADKYTKMMTVPESFKWIDKSLEELNTLSEKEVFAA
ncbi:MAG: DNA cytosine methyltransferase [Treponema sp.]|nr:DNA cytosine methyltransferase [Treponema sp.]